MARADLILEGLVRRAASDLDECALRVLLGVTATVQAIDISPVSSRSLF